MYLSQIFMLPYTIYSRDFEFPGGTSLDLPGGSDGRESVCSAGDLGSVLGSGRSSGEGNGNPLQCLPGRFYGQSMRLQKVGHD